MSTTVLYPDINVLVYAYRDDSPYHEVCRRFIEAVADGRELFGIPELVRAGFVRVCTNPAAFLTPSPVADALGFIDDLLASPVCTSVVPGGRHWQIFSELCVASNARGNLVPDAYLAALAIETDAELVSCDRDFAKFPGVRWVNPAK